ncbi:YqgE/AlgH family protein [Roseococcus sp. DSY-14]|uniref:YqgE/AlgH family protein n=1 Tax=Roseococcus sp. DSY-14 TaxID=3369650 RepID=UPI00387B856C
MAKDDWKAAFGGAADAGQDGRLAGQLLIAMPSLQEGPFAGTVICVCAHSAEGAMGLVLNKPIQRLTFDALLKQVGVEPVPPQRRIELVAGGPMEESRGFVLHSGEWQAEGSLAVEGGFGLTASVDILKAIAGGGGPRQCLLALGYAGWGPGQLEDEMARNAWLSVPADAALVFEGEAATKWRRALAKLHVDPLMLSATAGHA